MNLLDRYIFRSTLSICAAAVGLFAFILMLGNFVRDLVGPIMAGQFSAEQATRLVFLLVPFVISYALPMGILTGVLLTLGRLSADNEITAMRAAGASMSRIARPVVVLAAAGAALALVVNFDSMPKARVQYEKEFTAAMRANPLTFVVPRTFIREFPGYVAYVGERRAAEVSDIWIWFLDFSRRVTRFVHADEGHLNYEEATNTLILTLSQAKVETRNEKNPEDFSGATPVASFEKNDPLRLPLDKLFVQGGTRQKLRWMTWSELRAREASLASAKPGPGGPAELAHSLMQVAMVIQEKFNGSLAVFSFALIGVPLGIRISRRETSANLGVAVALALAYYFLTVAIGWLDPHPEYRPDLLLWVPNIAMIGIAVWLFRRMDRG